MPKITLSPTLFIILEFLILFPSVMFVLGVIEYMVNGTGSLLYMMLGSNNFVKAALVTVITPFAGGFLAYNYLERYKSSKSVKRFAKVVLGYSIIEIGLVLVMALLIKFNT